MDSFQPTATATAGLHPFGLLSEVIIISICSSLASDFHSVSVQALALRKSCDCPALPSTDPRAAFSKSVKVLLEDTKRTDRRGQEGAQKAPLTPGLTSLPTKLPAALLAQDALLPSSNRDQECKLASLVASDSAAPAPGPANADGEGSQHSVQS